MSLNVFLVLALLGLCSFALASSCTEWRLLFIAVQGLLIAVDSVEKHSLWGTAELCSRGSVIVVHRLSCSSACGVFPDQGSNPCLLPWQVDSLPLSHQERPQFLNLQIRIILALSRFLRLSNGIMWRILKQVIHHGIRRCPSWRQMMYFQLIE